MAKKKFDKKPSKYDYVKFDSIRKIRTAPDGSGWTGDKGDYFFKHLPEAGANKPITQVHFNHSFLTGLFRTKDAKVFTGDIKRADGKTYLVFKVKEKDNIEIFEKILKSGF